VQAEAPIGGVALRMTIRKPKSCHAAGGCHLSENKTAHGFHKFSQMFFFENREIRGIRGRFCSSLQAPAQRLREPLRARQKILHVRNHALPSRKQSRNQLTFIFILIIAAQPELPIRRLEFIEEVRRIPYSCSASFGEAAGRESEHRS